MPSLIMVHVMKSYSDEKNVDAQETTGWLQSRQITVAEMKLAQILAESGIVPPHQVDKALAIACDTDQALESVLVLKLDIPERTIKNALNALSMVEAALTERYVALEALHIAHTSNLDFNEVVVPQSGAQDFELLLIRSGITSACLLKEAKRISKERNLRLGVTLLMMKAVPFTHLNYALECLHHLKEKRLSMEEAINALTRVKRENVSLSTALADADREAQSTSSTHVRIGDLLLGGRVLSEFHVLNNVQDAIENRRLIGSLLVESGLVSDQSLKDILMLQNFCTRGVIDKRGAVKLLRKSVESGEDIHVTARHLGSFNDDSQFAAIAMETLINAGLVKDRDLSRAQMSFSYLEMGPLRALVAAGTICASARTAALECAQLQARDLITREEAINVLHYCDRNNTGYEDAFRALGISKIDERQKQIDHAITSEFKTNKKLAPKMHYSFQFVLMLFVAFCTVLGTIILQNMDPCNLRCYSIPFLCGVGSIVIFQLGRLWIRVARNMTKEIAERQDTARVTVSRLNKPARARNLVAK